MVKEIDPHQEAVTVSQAALMLGSTPTLVRGLIKDKMIRAFKLGPRKTMIPRKEVERIIRVTEGNLWDADGNRL